MMGNYHCKQCGILFQTNNGRIRYCKPCYEKILEDNFHAVIEKKENIIPCNFNNVSDINSRGYIRYLKINKFNDDKTDWADVCKYYNSIDILEKQFEYLYLQYCKNNNTTSVNNFLKHMKLDTLTYLNMIDWKEIKIKNNITLNSKTVNNEDLIKCFKDYVNRNKFIPYPPSEYFNNIQYSRSLYDKRLGKILKNTDLTLYEYLISFLEDDELIKDYKKRVVEGKRESILKMAETSKKYTYDDLKSNLVDVFNKFYDDFNQYPSVIEFDKISNIDNSVYRKYYKKPWKSIASSFGYEYDLNKHNKSEKLCLDMVSKVLNSPCEHQKTWDWLRYKRNMYCDGYFEDYNLVVEYNGIQHRESVEIFGGTKCFNETVSRDNKKAKLLKEKGIKLLTIWFDEDWLNPDYITDKIEKLGVNIKNK